MSVFKTYDEMDASHRLAYDLGRQHERDATDEWTTRVAETSTDAATRADELEAERDWLRLQIAGCIDYATTLEKVTGLAIGRALIHDLNKALETLDGAEATGHTSR